VERFTTADFEQAMDTVARQIAALQRDNEALRAELARRDNKTDGS
jgi:hypothetical protein